MLILLGLSPTWEGIIYKVLLCVGQHPREDRERLLLGDSLFCADSFSFQLEI